MKQITKIKEVITTKEFKQLNAFTKADELRNATKQNLLKTFTLLYYTGCRINELLQLTNKDIQNLIANKELIINSHKTKKERKLYFTDDGIKAIKKLFQELGINDEPEEARVIRSKGNLYKTPHNKTFAKSVNKVIQNCLGDRYTSHAF